MLDMPETVRTEPSAELFFSNIAKIVKATTKENRGADFYLENEDDYPVLAKLAAVEIELEDGSIVSYFDLPREQQPAFLQEFMHSQAELLSEKIDRIPVLDRYISAQNDVVNEALDELSTKSGELVIDDPVYFFDDLGARIDDMAAEFVFEDEPTETKTNYNWDELEYDRLQNLLSGNAKKGDLIVALPVHGHPFAILDLGRPYGKVGHAEVFTKDITDSTTDTESVSIGARREEGVKSNSLPSWRRKSYLLGICHFKVKWVWDGIRSGFQTTSTPVPESYKIADWAEQYEGCEYLYWYEHPIAKWVAPKRFTCTTLIWWSAKNACDIRLSSWLSTMILPVDLLCDTNTYLKIVVE